MRIPRSMEPKKADGNGEFILVEFHPAVLKSPCDCASSWGVSPWRSFAGFGAALYCLHTCGGDE